MQKQEYIFFQQHQKRASSQGKDDALIKQEKYEA
jgi:hypothetical protein